MKLRSHLRSLVLFLLFAKVFFELNMSLSFPLLLTHNYEPINHIAISREREIYVSFNASYVKIYTSNFVNK